MANDANLIARVLDGRATPEERARLLAQADESPELLSILADSAAAMNAEVQSSAGVTAIASRSVRRVPPGAWLAAAAAVVFAIAIPALRGRGAESPPLPFSTVERVSVAPLSARTGPSLPGVRGRPGSSRAAVSVVIGARLIDYLVLAQGRDTSAGTAAIEVATALRSIDGGSAVATQFDALSAHGASLPPSPAIVDAIEQLVDRRTFRAAGWAELARLFAAGQVDEEPRWTQLRKAFDGIASDRELTAESRSRADRLLTSMATATRDWVAIERASGEMLTALAR